jgi:hypothetical protein
VAVASDLAVLPLTFELQELLDGVDPGVLQHRTAGARLGWL